MASTTPPKKSTSESNRWPPMLAVRGSSRRRGTLQNTATAHGALVPQVNRSTTVRRPRERAGNSHRVVGDPQVLRSAPVSQHDVRVAEHLSPNADGIPRVFATINCGPSPQPSLRRVKGRACLRDPPSRGLPTVNDRSSELVDSPTLGRVPQQPSFRDRVSASQDLDLGIHFPLDFERNIDSDQREPQITSPKQSKAHKITTPPSIAEHPCSDLITIDMLSQILHYHPTREKFRATLTRTSNERLIDLWLRLKAQKAAQAYADTVLNEGQDPPNSAPSSDHERKFDQLEEFLINRLLKEGLPELLTEVVDGWLQSEPIRNALELRAADLESIAHSDSLFTDGRNIQKTIPNLLRSFCISDPKVEGNPINVTSKDVMPRESIHEDELVYLNLPDDFEEYSSLTAAHDEYGSPIYSLIFSNPLQNEEGKTVHTLTSQINVSYFVQQHVRRTLLSQDADEVNEKDQLDLAIRHGTAKDKNSLEMLTTAIHLDDAYRRGPAVQAQQMRLTESTAAEAAKSSVSLVDWTEIALEESLKSCADPAEVNRSFNKLEDCTDTPELIRQIKILYQDHFILALSERSELYEVMCCSPCVYRNGQWFDDPFRYNSPDVFRWIMTELCKEQKFAVRIKWGESRADKWLYCTPMLGPEVECWVCILIDGDVPNMWED
ncbi:MAG: hypothetical protein M1812_006390 [Candelaria pacifica]|nr:MAG: hypothetical protein M1812_006390 [Candelaria pacifica]